MLSGLLLCYLLGTGWFILITGRGLVESLMLCVVPFLIPDLCKAATAILLTRALHMRLHY